MPQVTVYIRKEDLPKWESIEKKSSFMHDALTKDEWPIVDKLIELGAIKPKQTVKINIPDTRAANGICKIHGTPLDSRGKCLQKGCKYA